MVTILYLVRHAQSNYAEGEERSRGLTDVGENHSLRIRDLLKEEKIDAFISSPYERAIATIRPAAEQQDMEIRLYEDLRERAMGYFEPDAFLDAKRKLYADKTFAYPGGESSVAAQARAVKVLEQILLAHKGTTLAIGTHGDIMTLMLQYYDPQVDYAFWAALSMPDIFKLTFIEKQLQHVRRIWSHD
ncbi:histidine phosphatase family protein [Paenibacillus sp. 1011MAR3C5]|uniref:histidine phosphatase family protein n=1 Tax=Paenibacillus sp. 1011MAR3C5 TaxID=1675787 RepID=UPI000E6BBE03|nr:histidine phosphatase family protein [Paenibacillus sp. 1011MAR3C5]RJE90286.1 histidine phosphatase family protein [Paenibacillus sp. 1011MAR3C5]